MVIMGDRHQGKSSGTRGYETQRGDGQRCSGGISEPNLYGLTIQPVSAAPTHPSGAGWLGGAQAPSVVCYISAGGCWGGISAHSRGGANTHSGGEIGRRGETRESTAPSVWRCPPKHHGLPALRRQPTAKAVLASGATREERLSGPKPKHTPISHGQCSLLTNCALPGELPVTSPNGGVPDRRHGI